MQRRSGLLLCLALPSVLFAASAAAFAQSPAIPTIRTGTQIVVVDVSVSDGHGVPVHGLKQADFSVLENGRQQTIRNFDEHAAPAEAAPGQPAAIPPLPPHVYTNFTPVPEDAPLNVLLVDTLNTPADRQAHVRQQLLSFFAGMRPGSRLAIFRLTTRLSLVQGFTTDPLLLRAAMSGMNAATPSPILADPIGSMSGLADDLAQMPVSPSASSQAIAGAREIDARQTNRQDQLRVMYTLGALNQMAHYLSGMPGRKNLIWLSGSLPLNDLTHTGPLQSSFRETMNLLARAQVAVYPVDAAGLANTPISDPSAGKYAINGGVAVDNDLDQFATQTIDAHTTMRQMAAATGGKAYLDGNGIPQAIGSILQNGSSYYTLVYSPADKKEDGSYRKIAVRVASGHYTLTYRNGYYADTADAQRDAERSLQHSPAPGNAGHFDAMRAAMQWGAPAPGEILFKAILAASPALSDQPAAGNTVLPGAKPPWRLVTIAYAANPGDITMPEGPDGARRVALDFVALVYDRDGRLMTGQSNAVNVFAKPEAVQQFLKEGMRYQQQIAVPAKGEYSLRVGIHDRIGDRVGVLEVPASSITAEAAR
ncbi:VWA domain-containing protein [Paracidobacterium acidisoli]|nr:VWA domain-containing protein [Paracidobacterium acidisoli]MBT9332794.1 VWA domain-containing protein [Paracidobacterium acidisoli]